MNLIAAYHAQLKTNLELGLRPISPPNNCQASKNDLHEQYLYLLP